MSVPSQEASRSRSWYRETPVAPGVFEFFLTFRVFRPEPRDFETMEKETKRRFSGVTEGISITVFRPSSGTSSDDFVASVSEYAPVVTIGGRG